MKYTKLTLENAYLRLWSEQGGINDNLTNWTFKRKSQQINYDFLTITVENGTKIDVRFDEIDKLFKSFDDVITYFSENDTISFQNTKREAYDDSQNKTINFFAPSIKDIFNENLIP